MMTQYKGAAFGELSPLPFAVADAAYRVMINWRISQSILVSGEWSSYNRKHKIAYVVSCLHCQAASPGGKPCISVHPTSLDAGLHHAEASQILF
ncbi:unnamed protein product [Ilex paraguariensis]|uniref:Myosin motor domain-containing protein n=1 Tax=Ilex paraguariensis TaxID=185542 RepID=A0ABC8R0B4_9AQUA